MEENTESFIIIKFDSKGSAMFNIGFNNITPGQIFACLPALETWGKNMLVQTNAQHEEDEARKKLAVPKPGIEIAR